MTNNVKTNKENFIETLKKAFKYQSLKDKVQNNIFEEITSNPEDLNKDKEILINFKGSYALYEQLMKKPNMLTSDKKNMQKSIEYLIEKKMDTPENFKKLEAINYGNNFIEIGWVRFSREKLIPQGKFKSKIYQDHYRRPILKSNKKGIFKAKYNNQDEYYFSLDAYIEETKNQGKKSIEDNHIRKALEALPGDFVNGDWYYWANILANILNISQSGCVQIDRNNYYGKLLDGFGCLGCASKVGTDSMRSFQFLDNGGVLYNKCETDIASPCSFIIE